MEGSHRDCHPFRRICMTAKKTAKTALDDADVSAENNKKVAVKAASKAASK